MEHHGKFGQNIGLTQPIAIMSRIDIHYTTLCLGTQTVSHTLPGFRGLKICIQYQASHTHRHICYSYNSYDGSNLIKIIWSENQVEDHTTHNFLECHQDADHARIVNIRCLVSGIIYNLLGITVCWKVYIKRYISSYFTYG